MSSPPQRAIEHHNATPRLDRPVLVGNLVSGACWLALTIFLGVGTLVLLGTAYVVVASIFLAAVYGRNSLSRRQEAASWVAPWLVAVALFTWVSAGIEDGVAGSWILYLWFGLLLGTACYLPWQLLALAVRQVMAWKAAAIANHRH